ncbi:MAG: (2Fe-2S) ferredoxin domain-containing protein [Firmicutes bacterium]|nr:(2Fe-2S) ferredoxin domain-containing protein [Bacillota bacterium]
MKSLADLKKIREQQQKIHEPEKLEQVNVIIGMGTCGIAAGARNVLAAVKDAVAEHGLQVNIIETGCIGMCEYEPLLDIQLVPEERITYGQVTPDLARKIIADHIANGQIVYDAAIARLTRED